MRWTGFLVLLTIQLTQYQCLGEEIAEVNSAEDYERLFDHLWSQSTVPRRNTPPFDGVDPVEVELGLSIISVNNFDRETEKAEILVWKQTSWKDHRLSWHRKDYGGIKEIRAPIDMMWNPDIVTYNSFSHDQTQDESKLLTVISDDGTVFYIPPKVEKVFCNMTDQNTATCNIQMGSWTFSGKQLDLVSTGVKLEDFNPNGIASAVENGNDVRNVKKYSCCPEEYINIVFSFDIKIN